MNKSLFGVGNVAGTLEILFVLALYMLKLEVFIRLCDTNLFKKNTYLLINHALTFAGDGTVDWLLRYLATTPAFVKR